MFVLQTATEGGPSRLQLLNVKSVRLKVLESGMIFLKTSHTLKKINTQILK